MESFVRLRAVAAPLMRPNIDTDQIIPTRFLARLSDAGIGEGLFAEWRSLPDGSPDPAFVLHQQPWDRAQILVCGENFGCGSSREPAPRALRERGFRALIAPSYGDIFYSNCFRNGIVPVKLPHQVVQKLADGLVSGTADSELEVDLEACEVRVPGFTTHSFKCLAPMRRMLLEGLDEIALTFQESVRVESFRSIDRRQRPWAYSSKGI